MTFFLFLLLFFLFNSINTKHKCIHDKVRKRYRPNTINSAIGIDQDYLWTKRRSIDQVPINIVYDKTNVSFSVGQVADEVSRFFIERLSPKKVYELTEPLEPCRPNVPYSREKISLKKIEDPVDDGIHIYLESNELHCEETTYAYEVTCDRLPNGRPINTYIALCPNFFKFDDKDEIEYFGTLKRKQFVILIHETYHALGFDRESFLRFPQEHQTSGVFYGYLALQGGSCLLRTYDRKYGINSFICDKATKYMRDFFDCDEIKHVELDAGGSHLSERLHHDDIMSGHIDTMLKAPKVLDSELTLKILEDSGWYTLLGNTQRPTFGKGKGCDFVNLNCYKYFEKTQDQDFYCFTLSSEECNFVIYSKDFEKNIPRMFRYFKQKHLSSKQIVGLSEGDYFVSGYVESEFCPIRKGYWLKK